MLRAQHRQLLGELKPFMKYGLSFMETKKITGLVTTVKREVSTTSAKHECFFKQILLSVGHIQQFSLSVSNSITHHLDSTTHSILNWVSMAVKPLSMLDGCQTYFLHVATAKYFC